MQINRAQAEEAFQRYTDAYDATDEKMKLKIAHTYRVAGLCERIARAEGMAPDDIELAWLLGMLHDIGRFEQIRRYGTFMDAVSVDHAQLGADILFVDGKIRDYIRTEEADALLETAIRVHNVYRIPAGLPARTEKLAHVLRDADKIDILKVNVEVPLEEIYDVSTEELRQAEVSEAVMHSFYEHHATLCGMRRTIVDHVVSHISLVFELVFGESIRIVESQGYLEQLLHFKSDNVKTQAQFQKLREEMTRYLQEKKLQERIAAEPEEKIFRGR